MLNVLNTIWGLLKLDHVCIDNTVFRLHYKATVIFLISFSLFVTSKQFIGDPIDCIVKDIPSNVVDTYCWVHGTYTLPNRLNGEVGVEVASPGVSNYVPGDNNDIKYHNYYQWVGVVLFFQATLFYIPRILWKSWEGGRIKSLVDDLNITILRSTHKEEKKKVLINYFLENLNQHNFYALQFCFCELLNFINVFGQIFFMDYFLDGEFSTYGMNVIGLTEQHSEVRGDAMARVFPKLTKCTFNKFGPSGSIENIDVLCVLPLNVVNEKIYVFLWFWFLILSSVSAFSLVHRLITFTFPKIQYYLLRMRTRFSSQCSINHILTKCQFGDWFILYQLSKNIDLVTFKEILSELAIELNNREEI